MAETTFEVTYDGPALESGEMPVRELAPALLALGELFTLTGSLVAPEQARVALSIKATREGSFGVDLILKVGEGVTGMFASDAVTALVRTCASS